MHFDLSKVLIILALVVVVGVPFLFRPERATPDANALSLVIITPHNEQIRTEFERGFDRWYRKNFGGRGVVVDWRTPGGTSEIRKQLYAEYQAAIDAGPIAPKSMSYDLLFGGGSYEHGKMKTVFKPIGEKEAGGGGEARSTTISQAADFSQAQLDEWYGKNEIGRNTLYDPEHHWFGTALSTFGLVFNRDVLREMGVADPVTWDDLTNPKLQGWVALADPGQSGSICTTFDVILQRAGWVEGWRILRESAANSRYFSNSSSKVPIDVSLGEAAAGMCIDFYGRYQAQSILDWGGGDRVGYAEVPKMSDIDPDPISLLVGAPHPELAKRFIEFCLSVEGQSLWQYPARGKFAGGAESGDELGPEEFELRRMPVRRKMYDSPYVEHFVDRVNPFECAEPIDSWNWNTRAFIPALFSSMAIDNHQYLKRSWKAMNEVGANDKNAAKMRELFLKMPTTEIFDGETGSMREVSLGGVESLKKIKAAWKADPMKKDRDRIEWTKFFRANYLEIERLARE